MWRRTGKYPGLNVDSVAKNATPTNCADLLAARESGVCSTADYDGPNANSPNKTSEEDPFGRDTPRGVYSLV
jgi:hypothetical protein